MHKVVVVVMCSAFGQKLSKEEEAVLWSHNKQKLGAHSLPGGNSRIMQISRELKNSAT